MDNGNPLAAFDAILSVLESQGHRFESYEELEAHLAGSEGETADLDEMIAAAQAA